MRTGALANIFVYEGAPNVLRPRTNRLLDWNYKIALIFNFFPPSPSVVPLFLSTVH